jgi:hypothetical protein
LNESDKIDRYRREIRGTLLALGLPLVGIGAWALIGPHSFYDEFPVSGRHWVSALGPYDEHLVRDFGALLLGLGVLQVWAALLLSRVLVRVALVLSLVYAVPHLIFHASNTEPFSTGDNVLNLVTLALAVVVPVILLALIRPARSATQVAPPTRDTPIREGVTHGTR